MIPAGAIRKGKYKLIEWYENLLTGDGEGVYELFDIGTDIGETINLADSMPELVEILAGELHNWRIETNAQMLVPNPYYK
jgi:hypothetical protein